jgi:ferredoxin, 2Fe-2S
MAEGTRGCVVRVEPAGVELEVHRGESLMHAAGRLGYRWPTLCHGQATCTVCAIVVDRDPGAFAAPGAAELEGLQQFAGRTFYDGKVVRLACQAQPVADTVVTKRGVKRREG